MQSRRNSPLKSINTSLEIFSEGLRFPDLGNHKVIPIETWSSYIPPYPCNQGEGFYIFESVSGVTTILFKREIISIQAINSTFIILKSNQETFVAKLKIVLLQEVNLTDLSNFE